MIASSAVRSLPWILSLILQTAMAQSLHFPFVDTAGRYPQGALVKGDDGWFYGTTRAGGVNSIGTIFKVSPVGEHVELASFNGTNGSFPAPGLEIGDDGAFYGAAREGGAFGYGTIFKFTPSTGISVLHSFNYTNGRNPRASLVLGSDGNLYGTTTSGGVNGSGTVFRITTSGVHTVLHSFDYTDGNYPFAALVQDGNGDFYGTTSEGGSSYQGTVFRISAAGVHTVLHSFNGSNGRGPAASLVTGSNGELYGTTNYGGASDKGTVFRITTNGIHTLLHSFSGADGDSPTSLLAGNDGNFYGTTMSGGVSDSGTIFRITPAGVHTLLHSFSGADGRWPVMGLRQDENGDFHGVTEVGGVGSNGTVFKCSPQGTHTLLFSFPNSLNGRAVRGGLVRGTDGAFYGTSSEGGALNRGSIFKVSPAGVHTLLHSFNGTNGQRPMDGLVEGADGAFYGTTADGGTNGGGTVFRITHGGSHTVLHSFDSSGPAGYSPFAGLARGSDDNFYGNTLSGGAFGRGTVFRITPGGTITVLHSFGTAANDGHPVAKLTLGSDGNLYGTTGSSYSAYPGTIFRITPAGAYTLLHSFNGDNGEYPVSPLFQGSDGSLYGTTEWGGAHDAGTVFKITPAGEHTLLHSFADSTGSYPTSGLVQGGDGAFYGSTPSGGASGNWGTIFKITPDGTHTLLHSFDGTRAKNPHGTPAFGTDGSLYGTTSPFSVWRLDLSSTPSPLQAFIAAMTDAGLSGPDAGISATPFHDGVENLVKYAFRMNLSGPDATTMEPGGSGGLPSISLHPNGGNHIFRFEFVRRKNSGVMYQPQRTSDPATPTSWTALTDQPAFSSIDSNWERVVYEEPVNLETDPRCFGRVMVTLQP